MIILNFKKAIPLIISIIILTGIIGISSSKKSDIPAIAEKKTITEVKKESSYDELPINTNEMRGIWITYMDLSMEYEQDKSEKAFREKFQIIAENCRGFGFNTLIVQVRPFCDALYKSSYFPWSHILTGTQGQNPDYDALEIMCDISDEMGLDIHAWVNPYRVTLNGTPSQLSKDNPYSKDSSIGMETDSGIILDPSNETARALIVNGVTEIVKNYNIDGIQFDDYFYPTDINEHDINQYQSYINIVGENNHMDINDWRKANINMLICDVYRKIHEIKDNVLFGISPQGNFNNNEELYADVVSWCECRGFVDYICPQIYFSLDNPTLTFEDSLKSWTSLKFDKNVQLYIGVAGYKAGSDDDSGTWQNSNDILADEFNIIKNDEYCDGFMLYSYSSIISENARSEMQNLRNELL